MPVFEYHCNACGKNFSAFVLSFSTPDGEVECPGCKEKQADRELSMKASVGAGTSSSGCSAPAGSGFS